MCVSMHLQALSRAAPQKLQALMTDQRLMQKHHYTSAPAQAAKISGPFSHAKISYCKQHRSCSNQPAQPASSKIDQLTNTHTHTVR